MKETKNSSSQKRDYKLDIIKAISITFVLYLHLNPIELKLESNPSIFGKVLENLLIIFSRQIASVAVPTFLLVSLYLFCMKISSDFSYLKRRALNVFRIYIFWTCIQSLLYLVMIFYRSSTKANIEIPNFSIAQVILEGGPPLPIVGGSVFYFLFVLQVLTVIAFLFNRIPEKFRGAVGVMIILFSLIYFEILNYSNNSLIYWRVDNYIIYVPMAFYLFKYLQKHVNLRYLYLAAFIAFSIQDIYLGKIGYNFIGNGRVSIFFGVVTFFCFVYSLELRETKYLNFLSKYSLGIFSTHRYWQLLFVILLTQIFSRFGMSQFLNIFDVKIDTVHLVVAIITTVFVILSIYILKSTGLKKFIS